MDVATGATDMPVPRRLIDLFWQYGLFLFIFILFNITSLWALTENQPIHFSGDKQIWDRKANRVELFGHAAVTQFGETLTADHIILDLNTRILDADSNCVYVAQEAVIWGEEMHFNLDTRTGTVIGGRVGNESFLLRGERINKIGPGRFQTHWGDYTTCKDCSASWSLQGQDVDMQVGEYAYLSNVTTRIKDTPAFWLPYLIIPVKTKRQTGVLFPTFSSSDSNGFMFLLPMFWAINRSSDMTLGLGQYAARGSRAEWEGRYALSPRSVGKANFYYLSDRVFQNIRPNRMALDVAQTQELPWGFEIKTRLSEVTDNLYPFYFGSDLPSAAGEAFLASNITLSRTSSEVSSFVSMRRYRNLVTTLPGNQNLQSYQFDPRTVQAYPTALMTTNDRFLGGTPFIGGLTLGFTNFTRAASAFDFDQSNVPFGSPPPLGLIPQPGIDPIRTATRFSVSPSLYTTFRLFDVISVVPSLKLNQYFYNFSNQIPNLSRSYLLFQTDLMTQFEKIYEYPDDANIPRVKHLIRPLLTYSLIPARYEPEGNPFIQQIKQQGRSTFTPGYNFDNNDIVPYSYQQSSANYFNPLGNSLAYGLTTQWIRRRGAVDAPSATYQNIIELNAGQAVNFLELTNPADPGTPHIFTRFFSGMNLNFDHLTSQTTYYYYPDVFPVSSRHTISTSTSYIIERSMHRRILTYDRSVSLAYTLSNLPGSGDTSNLSATLNFSLSDYLLPFFTLSYSFVPPPTAPDALGVFLGGTGGIQLQSPSQCWKLTTNVGYAPATGFSYNFDLALNLTGGGFGGVTELQSSASVAK